PPTEHRMNFYVVRHLGFEDLPNQLRLFRVERACAHDARVPDKGDGARRKNFYHRQGDDQRRDTEEDEHVPARQASGWIKAEYQSSALSVTTRIGDVYGQQFAFRKIANLFRAKNRANISPGRLRRHTAAAAASWKSSPIGIFYGVPQNLIIATNYPSTRPSPFPSVRG